MIKNLRVQNFRKHADLVVDFKPGATIITGANGSGKTSLLEAIYIALQGKSWRSNFAEILRDDGQNIAEWWRIDLEFSGDQKRVVKFTNNAKNFVVDTQTFTRLPAKLKKPVILFEPNDLQLLYGSPARRRDFFDRLISQIEPTHATTLRKFERILRQRNNLLRQGTSASELFVWDLQFADLSEKIITARDRWIKEINHHLTNEYQKIAATSRDVVNVKYLASHKSRQQILDQLKHDFLDGRLYTKTGPQTHDIKFKINNHDAKLTASRGENRTIIFATLATMTRILSQTLGEKIYLLFDDIDSELDATRRQELYKSEIFADNYLFATTIKAGDSKRGAIHLS
ncbi:DNA replication and repair protein RecF [Candidatus Saccharibacteria bacterium]|nr:DNA replication and repair protein RecF [Candidatus Saccharibacteria bacterium]